MGCFSPTTNCLNLSESSLIAKQSDITSLIYTHFVSGEIDTGKSLQIIHENYNGKVAFAEDLLEIKL